MKESNNQIKVNSSEITTISQHISKIVSMEITILLENDEFYLFYLWSKCCIIVRTHYKHTQPRQAVNTKEQAVS